MSFFSIIIPVYNVAPYLRECLDSVLAQAFTDWEAICVDDGSTDGSGAILDEYATKDERFRVIHQKNAGVSAARNKALDAAKGEWLAFLDADDLLAENAFERLINAARITSADIVIGGVLCFGTRCKDALVGPQEDGLFSPEDLYIRYNSLCAWSWGKIYKRTLWNEVRFPLGMAYSEDRCVMHKILYGYQKIPFVAGDLYHYRIRNGSAYNSGWKPDWIQRHIAFAEQIRFFGEHAYRKAEIYTVGLYFNYVSYDLCQLARTNNPDRDLLSNVRTELRQFKCQYWDRFAAVARKEKWAHQFLPCSDLMIRIEMAMSSTGKVSVLKRIWVTWRHDGVRAICRKLFSRIKGRN